MGITKNGYETTDLATIKAEVEKIFTDALGQDLSLETATPQGQLIQGITDLLNQIDKSRQEDFWSRDLNKAKGLQLDIIGREMGTTRQEAIPTQILCTLQGVVNYRIAKGTKCNIIDDIDKVFEFPSDIVINSESQQITLIASDKAVYNDLMEEMQLQTQEYIPQIYNIKIDSIVYGTDAESDYSFYLRLKDASGSNVDEVASLSLALNDIPNVINAYVNPNYGSETSASGVPPHSVEIVILGGSESDIAKVLMNYLFATPTYQHPTLGEAIYGIDYNGHTQTFYITRPQRLDTTVDVVYTNKVGQTLTSEQIDTLKDRIRELVRNAYMNKTLYKSDVCNSITDGFTQIYAIDSISIKVDGQEIDPSYTCGAREYLYPTFINFEEQI